MRVDWQHAPSRYCPGPRSPWPAPKGSPPVCASNTVNDARSSSCQPERRPSHRVHADRRLYTRPSCKSLVDCGIWTASVLRASVQPASERVRLRWGRHRTSVGFTAAFATAANARPAASASTTFRWVARVIIIMLTLRYGMFSITEQCGAECSGELLACSRSTRIFCEAG